MRLFQSVIGTCLALSLSLAGQDVRPAPVTAALDLDGKDSAVELPPHIFDGLEDATIETWVNFRDLRPSRFYSCGGFERDVCVGRRTPHSGRDLDVFVNQGGQLEEVVVAGILQTGLWYHVVAELGRGGMELYVNGVLAGTNASRAGFADVRNGELHFIGRMNGGGAGQPPVFFNGQLAEFRVWKTRRTAGEIRENMFRRLTGSEPGLAGLWNFE